MSGAARILGVPGAGTAMDFLSTMENAAQQARENGAGEDEAFLYGLGEVVKRIGGSSWKSISEARRESFLRAARCRR